MNMEFGMEDLATPGKRGTCVFLWWGKPRCGPQNSVLVHSIVPLENHVQCVIACVCVCLSVCLICVLVSLSESPRFCLCLSHLCYFCVTYAAQNILGLGTNRPRTHTKELTEPRVERCFRTKNIIMSVHESVAGYRIAQDSGRQKINLNCPSGIQATIPSGCWSSQKNSIVL